MNLRETKRKVSKVIYNGIRNNWSDKKITKNVDILLKKADIKQSVRDEIENEARKRTEFMKKHTASKAMRSHKVAILEKSDSLSEVFGKKLPEQGMKELARGLRQGKRGADLVKMVTRRIDVADHHARTIARSSKKALSRVSVIENAKLAGIDKFVISGHSSEREYYKKYKGKPMTEAEILKTKNDAGWNPLYYCCGPNCKHTHKPYIELDNEYKGSFDVNMTKDEKLVFSLDQEALKAGKVYKSGGYLMLHKSRDVKNKAYPGEIKAGLIMAKKGHRVELVNELDGGQGIKNCDSLIDGEKWEYKVLQVKGKLTKNQVQNSLKSGKKQAVKILLFYDSELDLGDFQRYAKGYMISWDKNEVIKKVKVIYKKDKKYVEKELSRKEIIEYRGG